jgi:hypothetical protein
MSNSTLLVITVAATVVLLYMVAADLVRWFE